MKFFLNIFLGFIFGFLFTACLAKYASSVYAYEKQAGSREKIMQLAYEQYAARQYRDAAIYTKAANLIAKQSDTEWGIFYPFYGASLKFSGVFSSVRVSDLYNTHLIAFLYDKSGDASSADLYYKEIMKSKPLSKEQIDKSAKDFLDQATSKGNTNVEPRASTP